MSRYVNADKMIENTKAMRSLADAIAIDGIIKYIENNIVPDVEQVIRCKDCKYMTRGCYSMTGYFCSLENMIVCPNCYCSWGEHREDAEGVVLNDQL